MSTELRFTRLHPHFFAEASALSLRATADAKTLVAIRAAMDEHAVIVFHGQAFTGEEQLEFAQRLDGVLHAKTGASALGKNRYGNEALTDISNLGAEGEILAAEDRRRLYSLGNRLWHTDASFENPPGRYSMLHARVIPSNCAASQPSTCPAPRPPELDAAHWFRTLRRPGDSGLATVSSARRVSPPGRSGRIRPRSWPPFPPAS